MMYYVFLVFLTIFYQFTRSVIQVKIKSQSFHLTKLQSKTKKPRHVLATTIVDVITKLYNFDDFESSTLPLSFATQSDEVRNIWHEWFDHLNYGSCNFYVKKIWWRVFIWYLVEMDLIQEVYLENITKKISTNVPLGIPKPLCILCTIICLVDFYLLHYLASNIS